LTTCEILKSNNSKNYELMVLEEICAFGSFITSVIVDNGNGYALMKSVS